MAAESLLVRARISEEPGHSSSRRRRTVSRTAGHRSSPAEIADDGDGLHASLLVVEAFRALPELVPCRSVPSGRCAAARCGPAPAATACSGTAAAACGGSSCRSPGRRAGRGSGRSQSVRVDELKLPQGHRELTLRTLPLPATGASRTPGWARVAVAEREDRRGVDQHDVVAVRGVAQQRRHPEAVQERAGVLRAGARRDGGPRAPGLDERRPGRPAPQRGAEPVAMAEPGRGPSTCRAGPHRSAGSGAPSRARVEARSSGCWSRPRGTAEASPAGARSVPSPRWRSVVRSPRSASRVGPAGRRPQRQERRLPARASGIGRAAGAR